MSPYNRGTLLAGVAIAFAVAGVLSYFASSDPDGLEKTQEELGAAEPVHGGVAAPAVVFDEYAVRGMPEGFWSNAIAGVAGTLVVLGLALGTGRLLRRRPAGAPPRGRSAAAQP